MTTFETMLRFALVLGFFWKFFLTLFSIYYSTGTWQLGIALFFAIVFCLQIVVVMFVGLILLAFSIVVLEPIENHQQKQNKK